MVISRKGEHRRTRVVDRSAQPWEEPSEYHTGNQCSKPETSYLRDLKAEVERRRQAGLLPSQGKRACAGCGAPAVEGRILCKLCQVKTKLKSSTMPFICLVPGCGEHRAQFRKGGKKALRPYCPHHWRIYQRRNQKARMKRRKD